MKYVSKEYVDEQDASPLAEGRELKSFACADFVACHLSPLAEGRELKYFTTAIYRECASRPSRRGVN